MSDEPQPVHVYPLFGREHEMTVACWCQPERDIEVETVIIHHPEQ